MPQKKLYVDTNVYLRLAVPLHPLLFKSFCEDGFTLYITHRFQGEFSRQSRLVSKFGWVYDKQYADNRTQKITVPKADVDNVLCAIGYISDYNDGHSLGVQEVDIDILAHSLVLGIPVVTDDSDMISLGKIFRIEIMTSLDLMRMMLDCGHVSQEELDGTIRYMEYANDLPWYGYVDEYKQMFPNSELE